MRSVGSVAVMEMKDHVAILHCRMLEDSWKRVVEIFEL